MGTIVFFQIFFFFLFDFVNGRTLFKYFGNIYASNRQTEPLRIDSKSKSDNGRRFLSNVSKNKNNFYLFAVYGRPPSPHTTPSRFYNVENPGLYRRTTLVLFYWHCNPYRYLDWFYTSTRNGTLRLQPRGSSSL